jgi:hypothetical protein
MANGNQPDFHVFVSRKNGEKNFYTRVGAAWNVANDGISIKLDALPTDGSLVLFPPREGDDR